MSSVHFPDRIGINQCVQLRISKQKHSKGFIRKDIRIVSLEDVNTLIVSRAVAIHQISKFNLDIAGATAEQTKAHKENIENQLASKANERYYIDGSGMDELKEWILSSFSTPKATPSMKARINEDPAKTRGLSPVQKRKVKEMYESNHDAKEISESLNIEIKRIIPYLKTLDNV
ncbi:hypothetical protein AB832_08000 [Flavobacteriaceae bacterium (ex Bugula neritina AB1)]|nr:hypothetical protein AB832_08000 [Flavobacteriaceae bacterium (ex Bugula neritina AB1)]